MASASRDTEPELHEATSSATNMAALTASAIQSAFRYLGSTAGLAGAEQQWADIQQRSSWSQGHIGNPIVGTDTSHGDMAMKIGELAARAGCDVQTVRFYEREGLLEAPERESSGYRRYAARHLSRLHFIRHCRSLDIPLAAGRPLLAFALAPDQSSPARNSLLVDAD